MKIVYFWKICEYKTENQNLAYEKVIIFLKGCAQTHKRK